MWHYRNPVDIHAGRGTLAQLPALLQGRRALVITFPEAVALGLDARLRALLGDRLAAVETGVQPNPDVSWLAPMYERLWRDHADVDCIIALGGGSVIDCAKSMLAPTPSGTFAELLALLAGATAPDAGRPRALIAIPTTAGTGSEVTPWATLWDQAQSRKHSLHQPWSWPEAAIVDADLMLSLPRGSTLASGLDALSHALESLWNVHRNPVSASLAVSAAREIIATLPLLLAQLDNVALRERMAVAALQAGLAFSNTKTALAHSLSYDLTLEHGVVHGIACSFSLPRVMALAMGADEALDALLLRIFDADSTDAAIDRLTRFLEGLGVSTDPGSYGLDEAEWPQRVDQALQGPRGRNFITTGATR
ncbi:iron-containing alcohol dehydrogenase PsrA [Jeongeupia naejangsanensis]|uniref:Iron-containing alcohol dehydrogenase n=1 Tax=Jeongeupia naejangsanensis TaxID=613195 RepID=A0ABS2BJ50_9NEIS|nr:iron-containing alcohol dehydrogenase PsrA [Jeongeupia naejangsanensis]MBM3114859.1 iron-containing alcohol dehydrogenase [Jeongeupia naejangsanensis]